MSSGSSSSEEAALFAAALFALALLLVLAWLLAQVVGLTVRTFILHPHNRPLQVAGVVALLALLLAALTGLQVPALNMLAGVAVLGLVGTAWAVDTYYDTMFKPALTRETFVHEVLEEPWWGSP